jgi:hypothetical protein
MQESAMVPTEGWQGFSPSDVAAVRHWFIETEGSYTGPIEASDIERRWCEGEADERTLVWTEGMAEWQPMGDVPDFMYLALEKRAPPAPSLAQPSWQTTEAASLTSLVQTELDVLAASPTSSSDSLPAGLPIVVPQGRDPFARWWTERRRSPQPTPWPVESWRSWAAFRRSNLAMRVGFGTLSAMAVLVLVASLVQWSRSSGVTGRSKLVAAHDPRAPSTAQSALVSDLALVPIVPPQVSATPASAADTEANRPAPEAKATPGETPASAERLQASSRGGEDPEPVAAASRVAPQERSVRASPSSVADADETPALAPGTSGRPLTPQEVVAATRDQVSSLVPCVRQARLDGSLDARRYTFVLDWSIRADGKVVSPVLKVPPELDGSDLVRCFVSAMHEWRFRPSGETFKVTNFPLPVTVR